ncbi:MAG: CPBP family glutamic-type intramembrane protease, partial [Chromatiales bacterium]
LPYDSFQSLLVPLILALIKGPVEEFGWRGLALPLLQRKLTPNLGRSHSWVHLGVVASTSFSLERYATEPVVVWGILFWLSCDKHNRDSTLQ